MRDGGAESVVVVVVGVASSAASCFTRTSPANGAARPSDGLSLEHLRTVINCPTRLFTF